MLTIIDYYVLYNYYTYIKAQQTNKQRYITNLFKLLELYKYNNKLFKNGVQITVRFNINVYIIYFTL